MVYLLLKWLFERKRLDKEPPLFNGLLCIGEARQFGENCPKLLNDKRKYYGDVFTIKILGRYMTFVMDPQDFPAVIKSSSRQLDFHAFSRRIASHAFGYTVLPEQDMAVLEGYYTHLQGNKLDILLESLQENLQLVLKEEIPDSTEGTIVDGLNNLTERVAFEAIFMTLYGRSATNQRHAFIPKLLKEFKVYDSWFPILAAQIPIWFCCSRTRTSLHGYFKPELMKEWVGASYFVQQRSRQFVELRLSDKETSAHHFGILWAAVANTMPIMFWTLYHLIRNPEAMAAVRQEIQSVTSDSIDLTRETLDKMLVLDSVVKEALRLSTMSMNLREAQEDFVLELPSGKQPIRKGDLVVMFPMTAHMDPEIYTEPQIFQFDRFLLDGNPRSTFLRNGKPVRQYHMSFGSGPTRCPGEKLATSGVKHLVCLMLMYLDLELCDPNVEEVTYDVSRAGLGTMPPKGDVNIRVSLRV
ncbi:unnamed protein product [Knipowitschia caucasica]